MAIPGPASSQSTTQDPLRISINPTSNHQTLNQAQQPSPAAPKTSTGIPNDVAKYGGKYNQGYSSQNRKPSPVSLSQENGDTSVHPKTAPIRKDSGFKLPSIAYSPNPDSLENSDEEEEDDDPDSPPRKLETRSTMTLAPPKLPLLFFEEDSIGKFDFAYQTSGAPSSTHSQTDLTKSHDKSADAAARSRSASRSPDLRAQGTSKTNLNIESSDPVVERKASPKPLPPAINTTVKNYKKVLGPAVKESGSPKRGDRRTESFYWGASSPGSSNEDEGVGEQLTVDKSQETPMNIDNSDTQGRRATDRVVEPLEIKPIPKVVENSLTSANALAPFGGGPSDWNYFTDYDAEEVDDLALYTSDKPKTVELPAGTPVKEEAERLENSLSPRRLMVAERETLPTIQERTSEVIEDNKSTDESKDRSSERHSAATTTTTSAGSGQRSTAEEDEEEEELRTSSVHDSEGVRDSPNHQSQPQSTSNLAEQPPKEPPEIKASDAKPQGPMLEAEKKGPIPAHLMHGRVESHTSIQSSGLNSPIDGEDDGRERIIISLQVPDSPSSDKAKEPLPPAGAAPETKPRERKLEPKVVESPELLRTGRMSVFPGAIEMEDPYAGLDPWAKASLNRYVKLLKEEAAAETDEEKFTLFITFMDRERRNRTALYDMDEDSENESTVQFNKVADGKGGLRSRVSLKRKAAPVVPSADTMPTAAPPLPPPIRSETMPVERIAGTPERQGEGNVDESMAQNQPPMTAPPQQTNFLSNGNTEEPFVMVENPVEDKPPQQKLRQIKEKGSGNLTERESTLLKDKSNVTTKEKSSGKTGLSLSALKKKALDLGGRSIAKDRNTTPINLQTLLMKASDDGKKPASPLKTVQPTPPTIVETGPAVSQSSAGEKWDVKLPPIPPIPGEKTEKGEEGEGRAYEGDKAANRQTIYRPFSGLLRQSSVVRGSNPESKRSSVFDRKSPGADVALSRSPINPSDKPFEEHQKPRSQPVNYRYTILEPLLLVIPQEGFTHTENHQLVHLRQSMDAIRDDFSFIHKTVLAWDAEAKKNREHNERERHARTTQNEARIDALFNDHEIGYGDISQLEADFKRQEATKKAEEDRKEVETFVSNVFDVVWTRINYEMDQLQPLYDQCTELVSHASAGRTMFEDFEDTVPVAPGMEILLILYQKLMVRHQKAFEAVLERDRRLKKTEVAPWYALGSIEKVKKIERRFEDAEKKAILEFCRQRDERANLLMDVLDQNTLRGVGANQDYMESIMQAVRKISLEVQANGNSIANEDVVSIDEVLKAKTITSALARSSEQIVQTFHVADMLLNAADYEVSVANAKLSNADAAAFKRLREAKAKEDNKLAMDLEHRMSLIRGDTTRTQEEIGKLLALISKKDSKEEASRTEPDHQTGTGATPDESQERSSRLFSRNNDDSPATAKGKRLPRKP